MMPWPLSRVTRNRVSGSTSLTRPSISIMSSLAIGFLVRPPLVERREQVRDARVTASEGNLGIRHANTAAGRRQRSWEAEPLFYAIRHAAGGHSARNDDCSGERDRRMVALQPLRYRSP